MFGRDPGARCVAVFKCKTVRRNGVWCFYEQDLLLLLLRLICSVIPYIKAMISKGNKNIVWNLHEYSNRESASRSDNILRSPV